MLRLCRSPVLLLLTAVGGVSLAAVFAALARVARHTATLTPATVLLYLLLPALVAAVHLPAFRLPPPWRASLFLTDLCLAGVLLWFECYESTRTSVDRWSARVARAA